MHASLRARARAWRVGSRGHLCEHVLVGWINDAGPRKSAANEAAFRVRALASMGRAEENRT